MKSDERRPLEEGCEEEEGLGEPAHFEGLRLLRKQGQLLGGVAIEGEGDDGRDDVRRPTWHDQSSRTKTAPAETSSFAGKYRASAMYVASWKTPT